MTEFDRDAWLAWRREGIGASDVAGILSLSRWESPYSIWANKVGITPPDDETDAMEMGHDLEPVIGKRFHRQTGLYVAGEQTWCEHSSEPWARATLDGFVCESPDYEMQAANLDLALGGFEAKSTSDSVKSWEEQIPVMYAAQVQWQMWVTGLERTWLGVFHASFGLRFRVYEVERDEDDIKIIVERCREFYERHVLTGEPPATDAHWATTEALRSIRADSGTRVDLDAETRLAVEQLRDMKAQAKTLAEVQAGLENHIKSALSDCTEGYAGGVPVVSWRPQSVTTVDTTHLKQRMPRVAAAFSKTSEVRVLRLATMKDTS